MKDSLGNKVLLLTTTDNYYYKHDNSSKNLNSVVFFVCLWVRVCGYKWNFDTLNYKLLYVKSSKISLFQTKCIYGPR